jgi:hypothetical protein
LLYLVYRILHPFSVRRRNLFLAHLALLIVFFRLSSQPLPYHLALLIAFFRFSSVVATSFLPIWHSQPRSPWFPGVGGYSHSQVKIRNKNNTRKYQTELK